MEQVAGPGEGRDSVGKPMLEQFVEDCSLWEGLELEKLMEGCLPRGRDPTLEQGKSVRSPPLPEEEGAAETTCDGLLSLIHI